MNSDIYQRIYEVLLPFTDETKTRVHAFLSIRKYLEKERRYQIFTEVFNSLSPAETLKSHLPEIDNIKDRKLYESVFYVLGFT